MSRFSYEIVKSITYTIRYWYSPLLMNIDIFIHGFIINIFFEQGQSKKINNIRYQLFSLIKKSKDKKHIALLIMI